MGGGWEGGGYNDHFLPTVNICTWTREDFAVWSLTWGRLCHSHGAEALVLPSGLHKLPTKVHTHPFESPHSSLSYALGLVRASCRQAQLLSFQEAKSHVGHKVLYRRHASPYI